MRIILAIALLLIAESAFAQQLCTQRVVERCTASGISCTLVVVCD